MLRRRAAAQRAAGAPQVALIVLGGWFLIELLTLDFSDGIVHPYYASALGPGLAAMVGAGARRARRRCCASEQPRTALLGYALAVVAIVGTVGAQLFLIQRYHYPDLVADPARAAVGRRPARDPAAARARRLGARRRRRAPTLFTSIVYSLTVWLAPVNGTFPIAGRYDARGYGGVNVTARRGRQRPPADPLARPPRRRRSRSSC